MWSLQWVGTGWRKGVPVYPVSSRRAGVYAPHRARCRGMEPLFLFDGRPRIYWAKRLMDLGTPKNLPFEGGDGCQPFFFWTPKMGIIQALWAEAAIWTMKNTPVGWFTWGMKCYPLWGVWNRRWNTHWNPKSNKFRWNHPVGRDSAAICFGSHAVSHERVRFLYTA